MSINLPTKISLYIVAVVSVMAIALSSAGMVSAQENNGVFAQHKLWLKLDSELAAAATYEVTLINHNAQLVSELTIQLPFVDVKNAKFTIDGQTFELAAQVLEKGTSFHVEFPGNAVFPQQTKTLTFTFDIDLAAKEQAGIIQLHVGKVVADHIITDFQLHVNYPAVFPSLIYTSGINAGSGNDIFLVGLNGMLVQWGKSITAEISEQIKLSFPTGSENMLFNLPYDGRYQELTYLNLQNLGLAATDNSGNTWGIAQPTAAASPIEYRLQLNAKSATVVTATDLPKINYSGLYLDLPEQLQGLAENISPRDKLNKLYDYMVHTFSAADAATDKVVLETLGQRVSAGQNALTNIELAYVTAAYCQRLGLACNVVYGYLLNDDFNNIETSLPHVWIEGFADKLIIIDPYLSIKSGGYNFFAPPNESRLIMGVWNPTLKEDSVLGVLTGNMRTRPEIIATDAKAHPQPIYAIAARFPNQVRGGEFYNGVLTLTNSSGKFIQLQSFIFAGRDIAPQLLKINDNLTRVILPLGETNISIDWQREPNFLADETKTLSIRLVPKQATFQTLETYASIIFIPNSGLLGVILILVIILIVVIAMLLVKFWMSQLALEKKLRESRRKRKQKVAELEAST